MITVDLSAVLGNAEVEELEGKVEVNEDILWLEVAMDDAHRVKMTQSHRSLL